ncbi:signal-induced proliferation-associated 1-like protein 2 isoform X2 [Xenopus tropicalis]|uniref:Signal-induced proliferation-associated 1-like protein 2 isoform X2 n=1 Tax=Xenopus tropicalis TaxID=8364 RepID=A0A8J1JLT3_XENTR|nr:signal-induced proliferation-associated 1-like protein 2 isoform X2 [Xenopus tropicalis]
MQSDDFFAWKFKAFNGNMGPPPTINSPDSCGMPAVPKMGVRARVSEWPPKKDCTKGIANKVAWKKTTEGTCDMVSASEQNDPTDFREVSFEFGETKDIFCHSFHRGLNTIRQRSNSDVTISDIDTDDVLDQHAVNPNTGAALHREYGSTSSLDRHSLTGENFFAVLQGYRVENMEQKNTTPFSFSNLFDCDSPISPSLQAAKQISQGQIVRISPFDYMDKALLRGRERLPKSQLKAETVETSLYKRLRAVKSDHDSLKFSFDFNDGKMDKCMQMGTFEKGFAHYDVQSILFNIYEAIDSQTSVAKHKNITTGASAASQSPVTSGKAGNCQYPQGSKEDPNCSPEADEGDGKSSDIVLSCPYFRNEIGGEGDRRIALSRANSSVQTGESCSFESSLSSHCTNAGVSVLEVPRGNQPIHREKVKRYIIEHVDLGAYYYRKYFYGKEHQNYFGIDDNLGPVAVSIRREKVEDIREKEGSQFNYRIVFRTSELTTLRGSVSEDAVPSTVKHGTTRGLPHKEILEYVLPVLNIQCLRQASNSTKVTELLLKLDEQGLSFQHKIGILYCKAGQCTEEEMYNNETAGPAFEEFLDLLGQRVRLKGFSKYKAQLDNNTDSTGTHSLYTTYKDYELMFHVSTMLPYMPNNRQQLLRKRHIGNDIVTIIFQEPGSLPFTPKTIRSHFQHVFVIVRVHNPCTESVCYSVVVSRSKEVPPFGPPIPKGVTFPKSAVFRDFLLAKVINAENAAHKSEKFKTMATRTRQEYLKDLAENFVTTATVDNSGKFSFITLGAKRKERVKPKRDAYLYSTGAILWHVIARDFGLSADTKCILGISNEFVILVEEKSRNVVFNCSCRDIIGWASGLKTIKIFYERGECILLSFINNCSEDTRDVVQRLEIVTKGCETTEMTLHRNGLGQLGFHVNFEGIVADVEPFGFAWKAGLRQGSRLVEISKVAVATLTHEQMIELLRTSVAVKVVIIQPYDDGSPRRGCSELSRMPVVEYKLDNEETCEYKTPFKRHTTWHHVQSPVCQPVSCVSPVLGTSEKLPCQQFIQQCQAGISHSTSFDKKMTDGAGCPSPLLLENQITTPVNCEVFIDSEESLDLINCSEAKWHASSSKLCSYKETGLEKELTKNSPSKHPHIAEKSCSSHSSSNTLSSNASSSNDEKHFGSGDFMDPELLGLTFIKGASTDSGIDTGSCSIPTQVTTPVHHSVSRSALHSGAEQMVQWNNSSETIVHGSMGDLSELSSLSSGSLHSGSPSAHCPKPAGTLNTSKLYILPHTTPQKMTGTMAETFQNHGAVRKYVIGLKKTDNSPYPEECNISDCHGEEDMSASSLLQDTAIDTETENKHGLQKEDFLQMVLPDSPVGEEEKRKFSVFGSLSPRRTLFRTLSDESVCSYRRGSSQASSHSSILDQALPNDILFSTTPSYHCTLPLHNQPGMTNLKNECWFSDQTLSDKSKFNDPGLIPLPDTGARLNWSHLVDAARAFEDQQLNAVQQGHGCEESKESFLCSGSLNENKFSFPPGQTTPSTLTGKVNQLEVILRQLQTDLLKEKEDKAMLQAEVHHLRQYNMRLQEQSLTASAQLRKFTEWFFNSVEKRS